MKHFWPVLLLALSCKTRDSQSSANIINESRAENSTLENTIPEMDNESLEALTKGLSEFSKPDQRVVEIDLSKRISPLDARQIYNYYVDKYGELFACVDYNSRVFLEKKDPIGSILSQKEIDQAFTAGSFAGLRSKVSFDDLVPFLKDVKVWQNVLAKSRKDLIVYPKRSCLALTTKDKEQTGANYWHSDSVGDTTIIWTIYGRRTIYTLKSTEPTTKKEILSPPYGSVVAFKGDGNPDGVEPVLHAIPGKKHEKSKPAERMTFVTFFEAFKEP